MSKILVVDDAPTFRLYLRQILESAGFFVDEAVNGIEALEKALTCDVGMYLIDINMPKMDGISLVCKLRGNTQIGQMPIIMISTETKQHEKHMAFEAGANFYLVKPINAKELIGLAYFMMGKPYESVAESVFA